MLKKLLILAMFLPSLSQDEFDLDDEAVAAEEINFDVDCTFEDKKTAYDDFKYAGDINMGMKIWYSDAYRAMKKWRKETDEARKKNYETQIEKSSWQMLVSDPEGKFEKKLKRRGKVKQIVLVAERLGEIYIAKQDAEMLGTLLSRMSKFIGSSTKLNKYAVTYYNSSNNQVCEAKQYASWISTIEKIDANKDNLKALYKAYVSVLTQLGAKDKAIEAGEEYLAFDSSDNEILEIINGLKGDPYEILNSYREKLEAEPNDMATIERAAPLAADIDENEDAYKWYKLLLARDSKNLAYLKNITKVAYKLEKQSDVIKYGKSLKDLESREYVIKAYIAKGQFKSAYSIAAAVQSSDNANGHYLKGLVYEETANAAQDDSKIGKKDFEWRLIYRLSNIEYLMGGSAGKQRAKKINLLIPNKGALFLKKQRVKPQAGKFSSWISWQKSYDKKIYGPDM